MIAGAGGGVGVDAFFEGHFVLVSALPRFAAPPVQLEVVVRAEPVDWLTDHVDHRRLVDIVPGRKI